MGAYLSRPVTDKKSAEGENSALVYGVSAMQGWRTSMEDAHAAVLELEEQTSLFGVFDGHGGREVARFCSRHLAQAVASSEAYRRGEYGQALIEAYLKMDEIMCTEEGRKELLVLANSDEHVEKEGGQSSKREGTRASETGSSTVSPSLRRLESLKAGDNAGASGSGDGAGASREEGADGAHADGTMDMKKQYSGPVAGCTAVVALVHREQLVVANAGDSRAVLSRSGVAVPLSHDHKPEQEKERQRILRAGGFITDGRVNGSLNLSRAIGDMDYKQSAKLSPAEQIVTAYPDIQTVHLAPGDEFMVIACDGIWDVMSNQAAVDFVRERLVESVPLSRVCEELMDKCIAKDTQGFGLGCDNMSVIVVVFKEKVGESSSLGVKGIGKYALRPK